MRQYPLQSLNTFGIEAYCSCFRDVRSINDLEQLRTDGAFQQPHLILGGGSNILFTKDAEGCIIKIGIEGLEFKELSDEVTEVTAGAGVQWHDLVMQTVERGLGGIENLSLIPGCAGAAPIQNIGAYGVEIKDVLTCVEVFDKQTGELSSLANEDCHFGYRDSIFKREAAGKYIVTRIRLQLKRNPVLNTSYGAIGEELAKTGKNTFSIRDVSDAVIRIRRSKLPDPAEVGNAGSFFKNPEIKTSAFLALRQKFPDAPGFILSDAIVKVPAGWLIEQAGWKGYREGNYGVHARQALVLVNYGGAKGEDILKLSEKIQASIQEKFGIALEREVNVV